MGGLAGIIEHAEMYPTEVVAEPSRPHDRGNASGEPQAIARP
jgi:hypothetical protein